MAFFSGRFYRCLADKLATVGGVLALLNFLQEPTVMGDKPLDGFDRKSLTVLAAMVGQFRKLDL